MSSRGPDGFGTWSAEDGSVALGHRRLAIIGLGSQGAQPMPLHRGCQGRDASLVISFNGEIYNFRQLRDELLAQGHVLTTSTDTEVLLHLYEEHGEDLGGRLRGMFAIVIWDAARSRMVLARDPNGIKPLYYADDGRTLRVASQVRALAQSRAVSSSIDDPATAGFFMLGSIPEPRTQLADVRALAAGTTMVIDRDGPRSPIRGCSVTGLLRDASNREPGTAAEVEGLVQAAVEAHLVADVDVGVFLSGGIDSAVLLACARRSGAAPHAVTLGFEPFRGTPDDEVPLAREVADRYGVKHTVRYLSTAEVDASMGAVLEVMDQPSVDGLNVWLVSRMAADAGMKVALGGHGADEIFSGYPTFSTVPQLARWLKWTGDPKWRTTSAPMIRRLLPPRVPAKAAGLIRFGGSIEGAWYLRRGIFMPWELGTLMGTERADAAIRSLDLEATVALGEDAPSGVTGQVAALETSLYLRNQLLRDLDWASMAHSVEVRVPFVDADLQGAVPRDDRGRVAGHTTKRQLASEFRLGLPPAVLSTPKSGFSVPFSNRSWALPGGRLPDPTDATGPQQHWSRPWAHVVASVFGLV